MPSTRKKAVLITGAARRLGCEMALNAARSGYDVAVHYHRSADEAWSLVTEIQQLGRQAVAYEQDLRDLQALPRLVEKVKEGLPHLNALVNNASTFRRIPMMEVTPDSYAEDFRVNFEAPFFLTQAFAKQVETGAVVNMLDRHIHRHEANYCAYMLAKKALAEFTQMAALELAPRIRVNGVCPGFILPSEDSSAKDPAERQLPPSGKRPTAGDVAEAVLHALETEYSCGQLFYVDGGERLVAS